MSDLWPVGPHSLAMTVADEGAELSTPAFWDNRYSTADTSSNQPTHEWFRGFESLRPWLSKSLFEVRPAEQNPFILHLGCGDSVSPQVLTAARRPTYPM